VIRTARLTLEPLTVAHAPAMFALLVDPALYTYLDFPPPPSLEHLQRVYARLETRRSPDGTEAWLNWIVVRDGEAIGFVQATIYPDHSANVAYVLGSAHWGRGYAIEAVTAMLAELGGGKCFATVDARNARSIRLLERLGFRHAGGERYERNAAVSAAG
jgi:RimJ/RimL family protein N-acetyltransferase